MVGRKEWKDGRKVDKKEGRYKKKIRQEGGKE